MLKHVGTTVFAMKSRLYHNVYSSYIIIAAVFIQIVILDSCASIQTKSAWSRHAVYEIKLYYRPQLFEVIWQKKQPIRNGLSISLPLSLWIVWHWGVNTYDGFSNAMYHPSNWHELGVAKIIHKNMDCISNMGVTWYLGLCSTPNLRCKSLVHIWP